MKNINLRLRDTEDEMVGWHHQFDGCEFEQTLGDGEGQGSLVCCNPWVVLDYIGQIWDGERTFKQRDSMYESIEVSKHSTR